jgi:hypothetical protein
MSENMVKLTSRSSRSTATLPSPAAQEAEAGVDETPESWEVYAERDSGGGGGGFVTQASGSAGLLPQLESSSEDFGWSTSSKKGGDVSTEPVSHDHDDDDESLLEPDVDLVKVDESANSSKVVANDHDEPCIFVNLDKLCGFKVSAEQVKKKCTQ